MDEQCNPLWFILVPITILTLVTIGKCYVIVEAGKVGIVKSFGAVQMTELPEGLHFITPFVDEVYHMDTRIQGVHEESWSSSKDLQQVRTSMALQYYVVGEVAPILYQKVGSRSVMVGAVIGPAMKESAKAVTAKWTSEELITQRQEVKSGIKDDINTFINVTLSAKHIHGGIVVANVAITDFTFQAAFNHAIEMKVKAEQEALQAENEKITTITKAEAAAEIVKVQADAVAYEIETVAQAKADSITVQADALKNKPELLELRMIEKWNGKLPVYNGAAGGMLLNVD